LGFRVKGCKFRVQDSDHVACSSRPYQECDHPVVSNRTRREVRSIAHGNVSHKQEYFEAHASHLGEDQILRFGSLRAPVLGGACRGTIVYPSAHVRRKWEMDWHGWRAAIWHAAIAGRSIPPSKSQIETQLIRDGGVAHRFIEARNKERGGMPQSHGLLRAVTSADHGRRQCRHTPRD